jgi:hypothetical protein
MKTGGNFSKIGSTCIVLILCFSALLLILLGLRLGIALPAHAYTLVSAACTAPSITISPTSGPAGQSTTVSGTGVLDNTNNACTALSGGTVTFGIGTTDCSSPATVGTSATTDSSGSFSSTFNWPTTGTGSAAGTYQVCVTLGGGNGTIDAGAFTVTASSASSASVSADSSSYTVGDDISVSGSGFPDSTSVTVELQSSDGKTTTTLGNVTTDGTGSFTQDYTVPAHPLNSVVVKATAGSTTATSSSFTVTAKAASKPKSTPKPAPVPTPIPPAPVVLIATPTPVPAVTDTPTAVPTDMPTAVPSPAVAPAPTAVPVVVNHTASTPFSGSLVVGLAIGLGALLGLGLLFVVGRLVLRKYLSPDPPTNMPPAGVPPWMQPQGDSLQGNTMTNGVPFAQAMPFNSPFPPGSGGYPPGYGPPQQVPFTGPFQPSGGLAPTGVAQEPLPPNDWFAPPNQ